MKQILFSLLMVAALVSLKAQATKSVVYDSNAEVRKVDNFTGVDVSGAISLYLSQGNENAVAISVEGSDKDKVKTEVRNGVLNIFVESGFWNKWNWNDKRIKAYVTVKDISKLYASGASRIIIVDKLNTTGLKVVTSGASSIKGEIHANNLKLNVSGASNANISGTTDDLNINASGASTLKAYNLVASSCSAEASGASSVKVNVTKEFAKVHATGASSIHYRGDAIVRNFEASGASSIKKDSGK